MPGSSSLPFWDQGALNRDPRYGPLIGIETRLPEGTTDPLPDGFSPWDVIYFNNVRAPGICRVEGGRRRLIDHRGTPGSSGDIAALMAYQLAEFTIYLTLWTPAQWDVYQQLVRTLYPKPAPSLPTVPGAAAAKVATVSVRHPSFQLLQVNDVYVVDIRAPRHVGSLIMEAVIDTVEFQTPVNEGVRQFGAALDNGNGTFSPATPRAQPAGPDTKTQP